MYLLKPRAYFFDDTSTTEIYTLSLHDALPISEVFEAHDRLRGLVFALHSLYTRPVEMYIVGQAPPDVMAKCVRRSEEHTSELQSHVNLVCRLLLEKTNASDPFGPPAGDAPRS